MVFIATGIAHSPAEALKDVHQFKTEIEPETPAAMYPQNARLVEAAGAG
jgi:hypothetical protein